MQTTTPPEGLAAMPPGPRLAAALHQLELASVPNDRILDVLQAQYRQLCHDQALMTATIAEVGRCDAADTPGYVTRLDEPGRYAPDESRAALRWTRRAAEDEHDLAEAVVHGMPILFAAWLAGEVDRPRVRVFVRYLAGLTPSQIERICRIAVPKAPKLTTGQLAVLLRRMVIAIDPDATNRWYRKGVREGDVTAYIAHDGTVVITATGLPADEAEAACTRVQDLAAAVKRAGHPGRIGEIRGAVFLGLLDGRFHHHTTDQIIAALLADSQSTDGHAGAPPVDQSTGSATPASPAQPDPAQPDPDGAAERRDPATGSTVRRAGEAADSTEITDTGESADNGKGAGSSATGCSSSCVRAEERVGIEVRVGLATLLGHDEHPAEIPGLGLLLAPTARARVALQRRAEWRFAVTDTDGRLIAEGTTRRRPAAVHGIAMRRDGPPGGIVELHLTDTLLAELAAAEPTLSDGWGHLIADIADQHRRYEEHLRDLDSRPGDRLPGAALRRHTEIRDRTCTFTGCRRRAHACDQDHTTDYQNDGRTVRANTGPACGHDHDVKHRGGWTVEQPDPGRFIWRSPLGGEYHTQGEFLLPEMPEPDPVNLEPDFPTARIVGPIVQRPPPEPPRAAPPAPQTEDPDGPPPF
jgi:hypothetical protein